MNKQAVVLFITKYDVGVYFHAAGFRRLGVVTSEDALVNAATVDILGDKADRKWKWIGKSSDRENEWNEAVKEELRYENISAKKKGALQLQ